MQYIAVIDYEHLDNGMFLSSLARSIARQQDVQPIIVHGDSEYTERIIQTGVMREEARVRSIKELNHRLIALFADEGVSVVGINGYQRELITFNDNDLNLDLPYFQQLPHPTALLISNLVRDTESGQIFPVPLAEFARFLQSKLNIPELFIFSRSDSDELFEVEQKPGSINRQELDSGFRDTFIPAEFHNYSHPVRLTTAREFHRIPALDKTSIIK